MRMFSLIDVSLSLLNNESHKYYYKFSDYVTKFMRKISSRELISGVYCLFIGSFCLLINMHLLNMH